MIQENIKSLQTILNEKLIQNEIFLEGKNPFPVSLSPYLISHSRYKDLVKNCEVVLSAIEKITHLYTKDKSIQKLFPELEDYRFLTKLDVNYTPSI